MPTYRPDTELLADYASGTASAGVSLLVASHLTYSPESRGVVEKLDRIGGACFAESDVPSMPDVALSAVFARIDLEEDAITIEDGPEPVPLPRPVLDVVGMPFDAIPWRFRLPGVSEYELDGFGDEKVSLLRARPGTGTFQHTHKGREMTLVLAGAMQDGDCVYRAGDLAVNDEDDDHRPQIVGDDTCYCLVVMSGGLHFTGPFSRALNFLGE